MMYGCIAEKLGHSFSKEIHNRLFDYSYELTELSREALDSFMREKKFKAINVTIPYKETVIPYLDEVSDIAKQIGAVNTIINDNGYLRGYNTDFSGMCALIERNDISLKGKKVLIFGSGGTSKTALAVAEHMDCREVYRVSRDGKEDCITYEEAGTHHTDAEVLINTTPVGMYPNIYRSPVELSDYPCVSAIVDAVYNPLRSKLVYDGQKRDITAVGGLYMLVAQAAFAAEKFICTKVEQKEIDRVYQELLLLKTNIVLVGKTETAKETGRILAEQRGVPLVVAEAEEHGSLTPTEAIKSISLKQNVVIAVSDRIASDEIYMDLLAENGKIYFVDEQNAEASQIAERIQTDFETIW